MRSRCVVLTCALMLACQTPRSREGVAPAEEPLFLTLVGTNDVHGWIAGRTESFPQGDIVYGGAAAFAGYLNVLRRENPNGVVLVDAGDLFQGTLLANLTEGQVVIEAFNLLGYDAAAIGNHEFDYGPQGPLSAPDNASMDPFGALKERIAQARFPLLSANIYEAQSARRPAWLPPEGTVMLERKGIKIGVIGLTTPQTPTVTLPVNVESLKFRPLSSEALAAATRLRAQGADLVVAVVHAGGRCSDVSSPHNVSSCDASSSEIFEMVNSLPFGALDVVVAGHTHARIGHWVNGAAVVESWAYGRHFGVVEVAVDPTTRRMVREKTRIQSGIEICTTWDTQTKSCNPETLRPNAAAVVPGPALFHERPIRIDERIVAALRPVEAQVLALQHRRLGLTVVSPIRRAYDAESTLGNLVADSLKAIAHADVGLMNAGGLRADFLPGPLTYGAVYEVLPFDNTVAKLELTGEQLQRLLARAYAGSKGVFQVSGLQVELTKCNGQQRLSTVKLAGGQSLNPTTKYTVALPDFLARGGDGLSAVVMTLDPGQVDVSPATNLRDELIALWQRRGSTVAPAPLGRIQIVENGTQCTQGR